MIDLEYARREFDRYLEAFDREDDKIKLKIVHTEGVIRCASEIARRMELPKEDCQLAELIALLHDIGRFEQLRQFNSFEPATMDHAAYGVQLLFGEDKLIRRFIREDTWDAIIREAIARHSDYKIEGEMEEQRRLHVLLIRDADKLDNCRVKLVDSMETLLDVSPEEVGRQAITEEVWNACLSHTSILSSLRKTKMDYWVSYVAYFFDINFPETFSIILEEQYVQRIVGRIPYSNPDTERKMRLLEEMVLQYAKERCPE